METVTDRPQKIEIHRVRDGKDLREAMFLGPMDDQQLSSLRKLVEADYQSGAVTRVLFSNDALGMSLTYAWFKPGYPLPRHSHSADCLYYIISGRLQFGEEALGAGDTIFVPAGALYKFETGPERVEFVEFRKGARYDIRFQAPTKAWDRQLEQTKTHASHWGTDAAPEAVRRMSAEV
jgi:quercetin dioxygenase-like cupin family protein